MKPSFEQFSRMHEVRNDLCASDWNAARSLPKDERKVERAMINLATKVAQAVLIEWEHGAAL